MGKRSYMKQWAKKIFCVCLSVLCLMGSTVSGSAQQTGAMPLSADKPTGIVSVLDYGAVGDGVTDDTKAIQAAVSSGDTIYFPSGKYKISKTILITDKTFWSLYAQDAHFVYTGKDYAFRINAAMNCYIAIGEIIAEKGGGIAFYSDNAQKWNQYVTLMFSYLECATDCIYVEVSKGWCNENLIYGGRFAGGKNGVRIKYLGGDVLNGWKFYNCGIEGVTNGFLFDAGKGYITGISVINARYAESYKTILKTVGRVWDCLWIGSFVVEPKSVSCSSETKRFEIYAPIGESGHRGCITNGKLMIEKIQYKEAAQ